MYKWGKDPETRYRNDRPYKEVYFGQKLAHHDKRLDKRISRIQLFPARLQLYRCLSETRGNKELA